MSSQKSTLLPVLRFAHQLVKERLLLGDVAIDATLGNGHDTLMLAQQVGEEGIVLAFDVQQQAFEKSRILLEKHQALLPVRFIHASHANLQAQWQQQSLKNPKIIMFNLGYLPGADKQYTTQVRSSLQALEQSLQILLPHGLLLVTVYPGHPEGALEDVAISQWASELSQKDYQVLRYGFINQVNKPPYLLIIEKLP